ncbi:hypothetical protein BH11PSE12_BH11PSE12_08260 [soil metagenome]
MQLTNITTGQTLTLSHDLLWTDEYHWSPQVATVNYSLSGALLIETATRQAGRPISLQAPDDAMAWHPRTTVDTLYAWASVPGQQLHLIFDDGRSFQVLFGWADGAVIESRPVAGFPSYTADEDMHLSIKFITI